jgi:hypothetical protein
MYTLEVDFDVYKAVFSRRANESVTENDVLRELLGLGEKKEEPQEQPQVSQSTPLSERRDDWVAKGVCFPVGTEFRATYKGQIYTGRVQAGALVVNNKRFESPSSAAVAITESAVNGWRFWECKLPGKNTWQMIESLRR